MTCPPGFLIVQEAIEDTSILFALSRPPNNLGHSSNSQTLAVTVNGSSYTTSQRPEYQRGGRGVTGALLRNTTPVLLNWLLTNRMCRPLDNIPSHQASTAAAAGKVVLELGSGVGLAACVLAASHAKAYIATDHDPALLKLISKNISRHDSLRDNRGVNNDDTHVVQLDWSDPGTTYLPILKQITATIDVILCLDCVYSTHLASMLVHCLEIITDQWPAAEVILGQQLRDESVHAEFIEMLLVNFHVVRFKTVAEDEDDLIVDDGDGIDGFSIYRAQRKQR